MDSASAVGTDCKRGCGPRCVRDPCEWARGDAMAKHTPLHDRHVAAGARLVDFADWEMPLNYGSQLAEHRAVRESAGVFDVSHMNPVDLDGDDAQALLRYACANDVCRLGDGRALYTCLLNRRGGVIDDGIAYRFGPARYRLVVNAATRDKDLDWLRGLAEGFHLEPQERCDLAMVAIQGPEARARADGPIRRVMGDAVADAAAGLRRFAVTREPRMRVARSGYTGEDGYEVMLPGEHAARLWDALLEAGVTPAGLGARDTLRLEAGLALYGHEMDEDTTPLEAGLGWTVAWEPPDRDFVGRAALAEQREAGAPRGLVGLLPEGRAVPRGGEVVHTDAGAGVVTSGGFGPTVERPIALAQLPAGAGPECEIELRRRRVPAHAAGYPFVRKGKPAV